MPKPRDLAEERRKRAKAKRARRIQDLVARGYSVEDAEKVASNLDSLLLLATATTLGKMLHAQQENLNDAEAMTIVELKETSRIVRKYEPAKARIVDEAIRRYEQNHR